MDVVAMPQLGETVTEGTITAWVVEVGQQVGVDDALFEVSTEKVDTEVPSAVAGYVRAILVAEGETVPVGVPVAVVTATADEAVDLSALGGNGAPVPAPVGATSPASPPSPASPAVPTPMPSGEPAGAGGALATSAPAPVPASGPSTSTPSTSVPAALPDGVGGNGLGDGSPSLSPAVRRLLAEHALDPAAVVGSGRDGRITRNDVLAAAAQRTARPGPPASSPPPGLAAAPGAISMQFAPPMEIGADDEVVDFSRARLATAEHMVRSLHTAAHALVAVEVDYAAIEPVRRAAGLSYVPFVARAVVEAIRDFPHVNASVDGDRLVVHGRVHLGIAVDVDREALIVPVIRDADGLRLVALAAAVADLADRARRKRLPGDALAGGTFTLTNVGSYGTVVTTPIINQPQVAILSTDGIRMAPVAVRTDPGPREGSAGAEWAVAIHPVGNLSLSFDHRAFDGAYAAAFLARVREILQTRDWSEETGP